MGQHNPIGSNQPIGRPTASAAASAAVGITSTQIVPANESRRFLIISNVGNQDVYLSADGTAVVEKGFFLTKGDTKLFGDAIDITTSIHGITAAGSTIIGVQEFT